MLRKLLIAAAAVAALATLVPSSAVPVVGTVMLSRQFLPPVDLADTINGASFRNLDSVNHTASFPVGCLTNCVWTTGIIHPNQTVVVPAPAGTYAYYCIVHPGMRGTLVVLA